MITCKDLKVGAWYKFSPAVLENYEFTNATHEKRESDSVIVVVGDNFESDYVGEIVKWNGHQDWEVVEVPKPNVLPASSVPPVTVRLPSGILIPQEERS